MTNIFELVSLEQFVAYGASLKFNDKTLSNIIKDIYSLEGEGKYSSQSGRTFKIHKGFHSVNVLDPKYGILEKYEYIKILCSRIQELLANYFKTTNKDKINFVDNHYGKLKITEIWINILRITDYNIPHNHAHYDISGNFYLQTITKKYNDTDGSLIFLNKSNHHYYLPPSVEKSGSIPTIHPVKNLGIIFNSYHKHIVMPHFSDEDRIGVAFNAVFDNDFNYDKLYPIPYWLPLKYEYIIKEEDITINGNRKTVNILLKNGKKLEWSVETNESIVGKKISLDLNNFKETYTIDKNTYFI
jgi:hypothetical protein